MGFEPRGPRLGLAEAPAPEARAPLRNREDRASARSGSLGMLRARRQGKVLTDERQTRDDADGEIPSASFPGLARRGFSRERASCSLRRFGCGVHRGWAWTVASATGERRAALRAWSWEWKTSAARERGCLVV